MNEGLLIDKAPKLEEHFFKEANARIAIIDAPFSVIGIINEVYFILYFLFIIFVC